MEFALVLVDNSRRIYINNLSMPTRFQAFNFQIAKLLS